MSLFSPRRTKRDGRLDPWLLAVGEEKGASLAKEIRSRVLSEALKPSRSESLRSLFTPTRHILIAGTLPVVLGVALIVGLNPSVRPPATIPLDAERAPRLAVSKVGDRIEFDIQNGDRTHTVYRSTDPTGFLAAGGVEVRGEAYVDRVQDQADLVFYKVD